MIHLVSWIALYPSWLTDDLSYYGNYRFQGDRVISDYHDTLMWFYGWLVSRS